MKKLHALVLIGGLAALALSAPVHAQIINVQIGQSGHLYTGAGADPLAGDTWNLVSGNSQSDIPLTQDSTGHSLTGVSLSVDADGFFDFYGGSVNGNGNNLVDGYDYNYGSDQTPKDGFSIVGLAKDAPFTIYLYGTPSNEAPGRTTTFTLATANGGLFGADTSRTALEPSDTFVAGADYVLLTGTTTSSGTISGTYTGGEGDFNGFQVNVVAPEPATYALMLGGLGMLALVAFQRRRA